MEETGRYMDRSKRGEIRGGGRRGRKKGDGTAVGGRSGRHRVGGK